MTTRNATKLHVTALISRLACCIHFLPRESFLDDFAKLRKSTISFIISVRLSDSARPNEKPQLPLETFLWKLILQNFSKIYRENSSFIEIWQEQRVHYIKSNVHLWSYLAQFFLEWEKCQTKVVEKIERHFMINKFFSSEMVSFVR